MNQTAVFVFLQHGSEGLPSCLHNVAAELDKAAATREGLALTWWDTDVNQLLRTNYGVVANGATLEAKLIPRLHQWFDETRDADVHIFSAVGHSYGGVLVREAAFLIRKDATLREKLTFGTYCAVASPLCGACDLNPVHRYGALALGKIGASRNYLDLLLADDANDGGPLCTRLLDEAHLDALRAFKHRLLVANTKSDPFVKFQTASLIYESREKHGVADGSPLATAHAYAPFQIGGADDVQDPPFEATDRGTKIALTLRQAMTWTVLAARGGAWGLSNAHSSVIGELPRLHEPLWDVLEQVAKTIVSDAVLAQTH